IARPSPKVRIICPFRSLESVHFLYVPSCLDFDIGHVRWFAAWCANLHNSLFCNGVTRVDGLTLRDIWHLMTYCHFEGTVSCQPRILASAFGAAPHAQARSAQMYASSLDVTIVRQRKSWNEAGSGLSVLVMGIIRDYWGFSVYPQCYSGIPLSIPSEFFSPTEQRFCTLGPLCEFRLTPRGHIGDHKHP